MTDIDATPPADYLATEPTPPEQLLGRQADLHDGAAVPWWMFAKVVLRLHTVVLWAAASQRLAKSTRRWLIAGVTIALANIGGVAVYSVHRIQERAVAEERASVLRETVNTDRIELLRRLTESNELLQRQIDELRTDMRELRRALHRLSGRDPLPGKPQPDSSMWADPDKLSFLSDPVPIGSRIQTTEGSCVIY